MAVLKLFPAATRTRVVATNFVLIDNGLLRFGWLIGLRLAKLRKIILRTLILHIFWKRFSLRLRSSRDHGNFEQSSHRG